MATLASYIHNNSLIENVSAFMRSGKLTARTRNKKGQFVRGDLERANIAALIIQLMKIARDALDNIERYIEYEHRSGHLVDSTACAVYVDGELIEDSVQYAYETPIATTEYAGATYYRNPKKKYRGFSGKKSRFAGGFISGRDAVDDWFDNHRKLKEYKRNTVTLVAVAAMYYGYYLEHGKHGGHREIKVISGLVDELSRNIMPSATEAGYSPKLVQGLGYNF